MHTLVVSGWLELTFRGTGWQFSTLEAQRWFGLSQYQVRDLKSIKRYWIFVLTAYTFVLWHQLTGGVRRRWTTKAWQTIAETLEAFRTAVEFRHVRWLNAHMDVFAAHRAKSGYVWA